MKMIKDNEFYCVKCGNKGMSIVRIAGKERESGHLKKIWCFKCKEETNHVECKPWTHYTHDDFLIEYNYGNFDEQGNRITPYGLFKNKLKKEGIIE